MQGRSGRTRLPSSGMWGCFGGGVSQQPAPAPPRRSTAAQHLVQSHPLPLQPWPVKDRTRQGTGPGHFCPKNRSFLGHLFFFLIYLTVLGLGCSTWALCCCKQAFSSCSKRGLLSGQVGSVAVAHGLSCPTAGGILVPGSWIKPVWAGGFLTTGPPGKSLSWAICIPALGLA